MSRLGVVFLTVLMTLGLASGVGSASAATDCSTLSRFGTAGPLTSNGHQYCDVKGVIAPNTHFEVRLPVTGWHGQYLQIGCGALCGAIPQLDQFGYTTCAPVVNGEVVLAADDSGHTGSSITDGTWGKDDLVARVAFGLTSEHTLALTAKVITAAYYGKPVTHAYFDGCSTGGRQALMLAQRFPNDFDGIIAGAPASNMAALSNFMQPWLIRANPGGVLTDAKIPALHQAVLAKCADARGIITDPRLCAFDPASIQCAAGTDSPSCLTEAQVAVVRAFYRGPTDPAGRSLYNGGLPYGSEPAWPSWIKDYAGQISLNYLRYLGSLPNPPDSFTLDDVRFTDQEFVAINRLGDVLYNANNPDLRAFRAHGGKLIMYHGWQDQAIPPWSTVDYYAAVERTMGGFAASQSFSRLYMVPGAYHCLFGPNSYVLADFLSPLVSWVENGVAPGSVDAPIYQPDSGATTPQTVQPFNALTPVKSPPGSLNAGYDYIGHY